VNALPLLAIAALAALSSCEKVKDLAGRIGKPSAPAAPAVPYAGPLVSEISESDFDSFVAQPGRLVIVDFYADWCGPCRKLAPILDQIAAGKRGAVLVGKVNVDRSGALAARHGVQGIPDVRIFRDGKQVDQFVGLPGESAVRSKIESLAKGLQAPPPAGKAEAGEPLSQPMSKDWLPPGMQRR
jgi:thioredoxin 1